MALLGTSRVPECERKVFTEELPADIPARARITTRARRAVGVSIRDHLRPVLGAADEFGMDWKIAHDAFVAHADEVLPDAPPPVRVLGLLDGLATNHRPLTRRDPLAVRSSCHRLGRLPQRTNPVGRLGER